MMRLLGGLVLVLSLSWSAGSFAAECMEGESSGYACSHIEFVDRLTATELGGSGEDLNDIWGWVDNTGTEYAIVGMQDGTAFVRISESGLVPLARLAASDGNAKVAVSSSGHAKFCHDELCSDEDSAWRDVKVYGNHAYIVSEATGHGLQIFDLRRLANLNGASIESFDWQADGFYDAIGHAHNIFINEDTGRAYVVGHDGGDVTGGLHVLDLSSDPAAPQLLAELNGDGYTHDVQCVVYEGPDPDIAAGSELCFASNEDTLTIWDVTAVDTAGADGASIISKTSYSDSGYTHQGWLSEDHRYFFLNDELDELNTGSRTHLRVFDVTDVSAPTLAAEYLAPTLAIDHNNYVHGRWLYQSNYGAGLRILDILAPEHPVEAAYFDTQSTDVADFYGTWSNFAFPSGLVALSDIRGGLFLLRPTLDTATASPDLQITVALDDEANGTATVKTGSSAGATAVLTTLHLPVGASFGEVHVPDGWSCESHSSGRVAECRVAELDAATESEISFSVSGPGGNYELFGMVYANEADAAPADNLASATFAIDSSSGSGSSSLDPVSGSSDGGGGGWAPFLLLLIFLRLLRVRR